MFVVVKVIESNWIEKVRGENKKQNKKKSVALEGFRNKGKFSHSIFTW